MLSLRSLAFILCSAIRRTRASSCAALHCFPDIINGRKRRAMAANSEKKMATHAPMGSLLRTVYPSQADHVSWRKAPCETRWALTFATPNMCPIRWCRHALSFGRWQRRYPRREHQERPSQPSIAPSVPKGGVNGLSGTANKSRLRRPEQKCTARPKRGASELQRNTHPWLGTGASPRKEARSLATPR